MGDGELWRLSENRVEVGSVLAEVDAEVVSGGPSSAGGIHGCLTKGAIDQSGQNLGLETSDVLVGKEGSEVRPIGVDTLPGKKLSTVVGPSLGAVGAEDGVRKSGGDEGKEEGDGTHSGWEQTGY